MTRLLLLILLFFLNISAQSMLEPYQTSSKPRWVELSKKLKEISGLALSDDGRLFAHGDEEGTIFQLDINNGKILKSFEIGDKDVEKDFEDLAIIGSKFFLVTSAGNLYEFEEGQDGKQVDYKVHKTDLKYKFDVEGLCYDRATESLLLACKEFAGKEFDGKRAIYSFDLLSKKLNPNPRFIISLDKLDKKWDISKFKPSAIIKHPIGNSFFILGGKGLVIIEISLEGRILSQFILDEKFHAQPEGMVILDDLTMIISDEATKRKARLTFYQFNGDDD